MFGAVVGIGSGGAHGCFIILFVLVYMCVGCGSASGAV